MKGVRSGWPAATICAVRGNCMNRIHSNSKTADSPSQHPLLAISIPRRRLISTAARMEITRISPRPMPALIIKIKRSGSTTTDVCTMDCSAPASPCRITASISQHKPIFWRNSPAYILPECGLKSRVLPQRFVVVEVLVQVKLLDK